MPKGYQGKVLFVATVYTHLAAFHIPFMKLLQEKGYEVHAAASSAEGRRDNLAAVGVNCWEIPFARSPYSLANLQSFRRLNALLKSQHFDLIHVHTPMAAFMGRYLARDTGQGPVLYTAHGFHFFEGAPKTNWLIYYNAERVAARWTDGLLVINGEDFENAQRLGFRPGENLFFVHGVGVDLEQYSALSAEGLGIRAVLGIGPDDVVITCVAELNENKNHAFLLEAWPEVSRCFEHCHLLLVGTGEKMLALQRWVAQNRVPRVHFLGYRRDVPQILGETDIATLVSKREGLPKYVMEAMAAEKPVVASNVRGNRDLVTDGQTGLLVEPGDVPGLVKALETLISDRQLRVALGAAGRQKIQAYSLEKVVGEMAAIYDRYLEGMQRALR
ncbi:MAG: putative glycosyltransferase EpsD [Actinobacteria bacterium]|nr:putative glycosyltransferase EpsD [Actinomycetota bacterium]